MAPNLTTIAEVNQFPDITPSEMAPPAQRPVVLVVDDENGPRTALRMLLSEDYDVLMARDVASAKVMLEEADIDLVISDIRMPNESGVDLLRYVRFEHPDIEVILLTGYGHLGTAKEAVRLGAFAYMEKPFDNDDMMNLAGKAIERRRQELERKQLEHLALEANRFELLGRIVSGLIHDLGSPLSVAGSHLELMLMEHPENPQSDRLRMILSQVAHCSDVVRNALGFLRHRQTPHMLINLAEVAQVCVELGMPMFRRQSVKVTTNFEQGAPYCVGDFVLIRQAVLNLFNNACQAMEGQGETPEIAVSTWSDDSAVYLSVRDTGHGISPSDRHRVFDTFFTTKGNSGTGLGLAAVRNIMRRHGGEVILGEPEGRGALFILRFLRASKEEMETL